MEINKEWIVEYSKEQNAFHRCTQEERRQNEYLCIQKDVVTGYIPIISFDTVEEADEFIDVNYENIKNGRFFKTENELRVI